MHDQSVSGRIGSPRTERLRVVQRLDVERGADPHRALRELAQVEDEVARRERVAGVRRRAGCVALPALRAGVEVDEVLPGEVGDEPVADLLRLGVLGQRQEPVAGAVVLERDVGRARDHVHGLRERDRGDEGERHDAVHPPLDEVRGLRRVARRGRGRGSPARRASRSGDQASKLGVELGDPERLEQEAGQREEEEEAEEGPVADPVRAPVVLALGAIGPPVVEPERPQDAAPHRHDPEPDDQRDAEDVEEERVAEVEPALEEVPAEHRAREVVLEGEDRRPDEEDDEPVEDQQVPDSGEGVALPDPVVLGDDEHACGASRSWDCRSGRGCGPSST